MKHAAEMYVATFISCVNAVAYTFDTSACCSGVNVAIARGDLKRSDI